MRHDLNKIATQDDLQYLFKKTSFKDKRYRQFGSKANPAIKISDPDEDDKDAEQHPWIGECQYMGAITVEDFEDAGYDALFIQTLVQMFAQGKLQIKQETK